jgi:hypothetical protein
VERENAAKKASKGAAMSVDALTISQQELVREIDNIAARWRSSPTLSGYPNEIARYHNLRASLKLRFGLDLVIKGEQHATDYRATLADYG